MLDNKLPKLTYSGKSKSVVPIVSESELQTVTAEPWLEISDEGLQLEGLIFDREHNLFLCEVFGGKIFKVKLQSKEISVTFQSEKQNPAAVKIH
ncbi:lactonase, partial [Staphylococcus capitis]